MPVQDKPVQRYLSDYLDWLELEKGLSSKSQENYSNFLKKFFDFLDKNNLLELTPRQITQTLVSQFRLFLSRQYLSQTNQPLKRSSQNHYLIALRSLLMFFLEKDILSLPPDKVKIPKEEKDRTVNFLTLEQVEKLLSIPDTSEEIGLRDRALLEAFFSTGLRVAEVVALDKDQFKLKDLAGDLELGIVGKGGHPRTVYFSGRALSWIKSYLGVRNDTEKALFINYRGKDPSTRLSSRSMERTVKKYAVMAGLPRTTSCHTLRHSFATDLLMKGVDLRIIQEFLGHRNIVTTQVYTHITKPHLKDIHRKFHGSVKENDI